MFSKLFKILLPTGRAYNRGPVYDSFIDANTDYMEVMNLSVEDLLNGVLPDNPLFTADWCSRWESFFNLPAYDFEPLSLRIARIRSMLMPVDPDSSRITRSWIQWEIDNAGWGGVLFVHENPNGYNPNQVLPQLTPSPQLGNTQLGQSQLMDYQAIIDYPDLFTPVQLGNVQLGQTQLNSQPIFNNKIANYINRQKDVFANTYPLAHCFYICGATLGEVVTLPASDEYKLRKLLLEVKPASAVGFLLIKYI